MNKKSSIVVALFLSSITAFAQKKLTEGVIQYDIVINTGKEKPQAADFLDGATTTVFVKGNKSRSEMVSALGTQATIIDEAKNTIVILKDYGSQKYLINLTPANWTDMNGKYQGIKYTLTNDTKQILGYTCKKAVGMLADGTPLNVWYTPDVLADNKNFSIMGQTLPGLPMEYEAVMGNMNIIYTVSKLNFTTVPVARFDLPKAGYRIMTYEESKGL